MSSRTTKPGVVFFGNARSVFSNRHFAALEKAPCRVLAVVDTPAAARASTNPAPCRQRPFTQIAGTASIPSFNPNSPNGSSFVQAIRALQPDLLVAVGYTRLLGKEILAVPRVVAANFHASLLPSYRGKHPVFHALRHGERVAGLTVHVMDPALDTGDILYQTRVRTRRRDTVTTLYDRIMDRSLELVPRLVRDVRDGKLRTVGQTAAGASYFSSTTEEDFRLDWALDAERLRRWVCTTPGRCFFDRGAARVFVVDAESASGRARPPAGTVERIGRRCCMVATGRDHLVIREARIGEGPLLSMAEVCARLNIASGEILGG